VDLQVYLLGCAASDVLCAWLHRTHGSLSGNRYSEAAEVIKRGADPDIKNSKGHIALAWAEIERADKDFIKLLKKA